MVRRVKNLLPEGHRNMWCFQCKKVTIHRICADCKKFSCTTNNCGFSGTIHISEKCSGNMDIRRDFPRRELDLDYLRNKYSSKMYGGKRAGDPDVLNLVDEYEYVKKRLDEVLPRLIGAQERLRVAEQRLYSSKGKKKEAV